MAKKKRRAPRKRADSKADVQKQLERYSALLDTWVTKSVNAAKKVEAHRNKATYYQKRLDDIEAAEREALQQAADNAGREPRSIDLGDD